jgi:hypothetical protein
MNTYSLDGEFTIGPPGAVVTPTAGTTTASAAKAMAETELA